ncbi:MAG TPA: glycosyltransferase, partial [Gaiellaceae bacterium]|nr:glycosyltransferase [Gaiellaceae bacterium]
MPSDPVATVVVVSRDRWSLAVPTLEHLLSRTDPRHPMVLVESQAPRHVAAQLGRFEALGRVRIARRGHQLGGNEARNIGADGATTEWIAFVENDCLMSDEWLERLIEFGESHDAASVFPAYLTDGPTGPIVHGVGADLRVDGPDGCRTLREIHYELERPWFQVAREIGPVERVQSEPHALLIRRSMLEQMGGLDAGLWSWFDHVDLGLHHQRLGAPSWLVPDVTCTYLEPPPVSLTDLSSFLVRWSRDWYTRSLDHLCATWALDRQ